jgi:hypothetical protein
LILIRLAGCKSRIPSGRPWKAGDKQDRNNGKVVNTPASNGHSCRGYLN